MYEQMRSNNYYYGAFKKKKKTEWESALQNSKPVNNKWIKQIVLL